MKKKNARQIADTANRVKTYSLIVMCMLLFVAGLFFAGRQHFSSMDYGMKNSRLRKQVDELESERRRLLLARETSISPAEIKKAAKRIGLFGEETRDQVVAEVARAANQKAEPKTSTPANPLITKTAAVAAAPRVETASLQKPAKKTLADKRTGPAE